MQTGRRIAAHERMRACLGEIYDAVTAEATYRQLATRLESLGSPGSPSGAQPASDYFSERTVTLITYGDTLRREGERPLATLHHFLRERLSGLIDTVHILPFYPYSSDDGFSVKDYYAVDPALGTWEDVTRLGADFRLMFDAVINHMSAQSAWFQAFLRDDPAFRRLFFTESPHTDLSMVTRPRTSPLLTPFTKADGQIVYVWTTFSADQVDLDYREPATLLRILDVLLFYVAQGAQVLRLDAIAYMWKQAGTTSIHLPQTHAIIRLIRAVLDAVAPHVIVITETNVPHAENISYFGDGTDEAQLVYNFTLPPLLLHALHTGHAGKLVEWLNSLHTPSARTGFFNFTASHDGIGVRPVEGILSHEEVLALIRLVESRGGRVSYRRNADGSDSPYELNITYVDATADPAQPLEVQARRFLLSQAVMLAMAGVPAIYIHSLLGSRNDIGGMQASGVNRRINRARLLADEVRAALDDPTSFRSLVFGGYARLLRARAASRAFHPNGAQRAQALNEGRVLMLERSAPDNAERVLALFNLSEHAQTVGPTTDWGVHLQYDLITGERLADASSALRLAPYTVRWLRAMP